MQVSHPAESRRPQRPRFEGYPVESGRRQSRDVIVEPTTLCQTASTIATRRWYRRELGKSTISGAIYEQTSQVVRLTLGDRKVKNITDPVRVLSCTPGPQMRSADRGPTLEPPDRGSAGQHAARLATACSGSCCRSRRPVGEQPARAHRLPAVSRGAASFPAGSR